MAETNTRVTDSKIKDLKPNRWQAGCSPEDVLDVLNEEQSRIRDIVVIARLLPDGPEKGGVQSYWFSHSSMTPHETLGLIEMARVRYVEDLCRDED